MHFAQVRARKGSLREHGLRFPSRLNERCERVLLITWMRTGLSVEPALLLHLYPPLIDLSLVVTFRSSLVVNNVVSDSSHGHWRRWVPASSSIAAALKAKFVPGLGGLAAAIQIQSERYQVTVIESAAELIEIGAGVQIVRGEHSVAKHPRC